MALYSALHEHMSTLSLHETVTKEYLGEFTEKIFFPGMEDIVDKKMQFYTNQILTNNDKLARKFDKIDTEVVASLANYDHLSRKVAWLEKMIAMLASKAGMELPTFEMK